MEFKSSNPKANRILYIVVVAVLCVTAIIIGVVAAMSRSKDPTPADTSGTDTSGTVTTAPNTNVTTEIPSDVETPVEVLPTLIAPLAGSISKSHDITTPVFSVTMNDYRVHRGIDIAAALGDAVAAAADGTIEAVWADPMMGQCVSISHAAGMVTVYKNLAPTLAEGIEVGAKVKAGDTIGAVGESAIIEIADEPHLHFEVKVGEVYEDPLDYISDESRLTSLSGSDKFES